MSELLENLREDLQDEAARYGYAEAFSNAFVAAQIKTLREDRELSQQDLADKIGTKQSGISRLENANYSSWKVETLRKLARAFGVRLRISFEEFGTLVPEIGNFNKKILGRRRFEDDPIFLSEAEKTTNRRLSGLYDIWKRGQNMPLLEQRLTQEMSQELQNYDTCPVALRDLLKATASLHAERETAMQPLPPGPAELRQAVPATEIHSVRRHKRSVPTSTRSGTRNFARKRRPRNKIAFERKNYARGNNLAVANGIGVFLRTR